MITRSEFTDSRSSFTASQVGGVLKIEKRVRPRTVTLKDLRDLEQFLVGRIPK